MDANHPVFSHDALTSTRKELENERKPSLDKIRRNPERKERKNRHGISLSTTGSEPSRKNPPDVSLCVLCKGEHGLSTCKNFLGKPLKERLELCMSSGICFSCLNQGHTARQCKRKAQCDVCKKDTRNCPPSLPSRREKRRKDTGKHQSNEQLCEL